MVLVPPSVHTFSSLLVLASLRLALVFFNTSPVPHTTLVFGVVSALHCLAWTQGAGWSGGPLTVHHTLRRAAMRLEVCRGESCKGTVDSRCPGGRGGGGAARLGGVGNACTFGRSLGGGEGVGGPWEEEREWEVLGRRRGSGRSLGGGKGVGGPWEEEREWEVLGRRKGSGRSLGGGEGVGGPCTVSPTHVHSLVCCCEAPSEGHMEQPHTYGISCSRVVAHRFCQFC